MPNLGPYLIGKCLYYINIFLYCIYFRFSKNLVINNTTQLAPMDKVKTMRKKNKEKRQQSKSVSDLSNVSSDGMDSVSAFVGVPLVGDFLYM